MAYEATTDCLWQTFYGEIPLSLIGESKNKIITRQVRVHKDPRCGPMNIVHIFEDRPASLETWIDNCTKLSMEFKITALEVHQALFAQLPEIFGRSVASGPRSVERLR